MQYLTTVNPYGPTTYFYVTLADVATDPFLAFAMALADLVEPIYVASISWGSIEGEEVPSIMASFDVEAAKLGLKGGTIVVSSGDDGANGLGTECGHAPSFPASSPNVLAVGATNAYDWSGTAGAPNEIVCQADVLGGGRHQWRRLLGHLRPALLAGRRCCQLFCASGRYAATTGGRLLEGWKGLSGRRACRQGL